MTVGDENGNEEEDEEEMMMMMEDRGSNRDGMNSWSRDRVEERGMLGNRSGNRDDQRLGHAAGVGERSPSERPKGTGRRRSLHEAVRRGEVDACRSLLGKGWDVHERDGESYTPLLLAAMCGNLGVCRLLVDFGANVHDRLRSGLSALHVAVGALDGGGHRDVVDLLIERGADVNVRSRFGSAPLQTAAFNGHREISRLLVAKGADVNARGDGGMCALHQAARQSHIDVVKMLIENGADVNLRSACGMTPAMYAMLGRNSGFFGDRGRTTSQVEQRKLVEVFLRHDDIDLHATHGIEGKTIVDICRDQRDADDILAMLMRYVTADIVEIAIAFVRQRAALPTTTTSAETDPPDSSSASNALPLSDTALSSTLRASAAPFRPAASTIATSPFHDRPAA